MRPFIGPDNLTTLMCRLSVNLGVSTSWSPQDLSRGCFTFYLEVSSACRPSVLEAIWKQVTEIRSEGLRTRNQRLFLSHEPLYRVDILLTVHLSIIYSLFPTWYAVFCLRIITAIFFPLHISGLTGPSSGGLNCTCSLWYSPPLQMSFSCGRWEFFLNGRTTKTSAEGENTIGCMYNLDLLMMGLWGLKHVEERG